MMLAPSRLTASRVLIPPPSAYVVRVLLQAGGDAQLLLSGPQERGGRGADKSQ